jgi:hypothetical protein
VSDPRRSVAVLAIVAFMAGAGAGTIATQAVHARETAAPEKHARGSERVLQRLLAAVPLEKAEEERVRGVFEKRRPEWDALFARLKPDIDKLRETTRADVRTVLPAEKQVAFDRFVAEEDAARAAGK